MRGGLAVVLALTVLASGCLEGFCGLPPIHPSQVPADAPSSGGPGNSTVIVTVRNEPGGPPVTGAPVMLFWDELNASQRQAQNEAYLNATPEQMRVDSGLDPSRAYHMGLRTDEKGVVRARVPSDRSVIASTVVEGRTWETAANGYTNISKPLTINLTVFQPKLQTTIRNAWGPAIVSTHAANREYEWQPNKVQFLQHASRNAAYLNRLVTVNVTLTWSNQPTSGFGDLGLGLGGNVNGPDAVFDSAPERGFGEFQEEVRLTQETLAQSDIFLAGAFYVGPTTRSGVAAPSGLAYRIEVEATFDLTEWTRETCGVFWERTELIEVDPRAPPPVTASNTTTPAAATPAAAQNTAFPPVGALLTILVAAAIFRRRF